MTSPGVIFRIKQEPRRIRDISFVVAGILLFAIFIHHPLPKKLIAFASLIIAAAVVSVSSFCSFIAVRGQGAGP